MPETFQALLKAGFWQDHRCHSAYQAQNGDRAENCSISRRTNTTVVQGQDSRRQSYSSLPALEIDIDFQRSISTPTDYTMSLRSSSTLPSPSYRTRRSDLHLPQDPSFPRPLPSIPVERGDGSDLPQSGRTQARDDGPRMDDGGLGEPVRDPGHEHTAGTSGDGESTRPPSYP